MSWKPRFRNRNLSFRHFREKKEGPTQTSGPCLTQTAALKLWAISYRSD
jgi:hypothetical protein